MSTHPLSVTITLPTGEKYEQPTGLFINNEFVPSKSGKTFEVENPATEKVITSVYEALSEDVDIAVSAAKKAFEPWAEIEPRRRGEILHKFSELILENIGILSSIEALDNGMAVSSAQGEVGMTSRIFEYFSGFADKIYGTTIDTNDGFFTYTRREPLGVCGQLIPFNFPILIWAWKVAPAIASGNTVVIKPSEYTPLSVLFVSKLLVQAGLPPGVVNIVPGFGPTTGKSIAIHPDVEKISFTGSDATGKLLMSLAGQNNIKKVALELGGKSPSIVFNDADIEEAIQWSAHGIFWNSGQVCAAGSRIYVQEGVYDEFVEKFKAQAEAYTVGDPFDPNTKQGSQISKVQLKKTLGYIESGQKEGARLVTGGKQLDQPGYFVTPTILADCTEDMNIIKEEIFGPVAVISKFSTVDEVIEKANSSKYGLGAGVFTNDVNKAIHVSNKIHSGSIWVNCYHAFHQAVPFGGYKSSGMGRENGEQALDTYTQVKSVRMRIKM